MTARCLEYGDIMLGRVLEQMCDRNDHETVLQVLQVLGKTHRAGYLTVNDLVTCLIYCGNRFADQKNGDFFREYVQYMPDINRIQDTSQQFTPLCKSYYYAYRHAETQLDLLQTECMLIDTDELSEWFKEFVVSKRISDTWQLKPLFERACERKETLTNEGFKCLCDDYVVPIILRSGTR